MSSRRPYPSDSGSRSVRRPCRDGGHCRNFDSQHRDQYSHPTTRCRDRGRCLCAFDRDHQMRYIHPPRCEDWMSCEEWRDDHLDDFLHPKTCRYLGLCTENYENSRHFQHVRHPQYCPVQDEGGYCGNYDWNHCLEYRHVKEPCSSGFQCSRTDLKHQRNFAHPFRPICKYGINCVAKRTNKWHLLMWTHPCHWGVQCRGFQRFITGVPTEWDVQHVECSVHLAREVCPDGRECQMTWDPEHMMEFTHPGIRDYRKRCDGGPMCEDFSSEHRLELYHPPAFQPVVPVIGINSEVDYERNYQDLYHDVQFWLKLHMGLDPGGVAVVPPPELVEYCHEIRPVHRCKLGIFKLVLSQECLISRHFMVEMEKNRREACITELETCPGILRVLHKHGLFTLEKNIHSLLVAVVEEVISEKPRENLRLVKTQILADLSAKFRNALDEVEMVARKVATQVKSLRLQGIGYGVDLHLGTHKQVFSVCGNHTFPYGDVFIVLKRDIMFHPDFDVTPNAGTSFHSGKVFFDACRPWAACRGREDDVRPVVLERVRDLAQANRRKKDGWQQRAYSASVAETDRIDLYHRSKMHYCLGEKVYDLMALELMAKWMHSNASKRIPTRQEIWDLFAQRPRLDAHYNFEGHLPSVVPLSYVDKIVISRSDHAKLSDVEKQVLDRIGIEVHVSPRAGPKRVLKFANDRDLLVYPDSPPLTLAGLCFTSVMSLGKDEPVFNLQTAGLDGSVTVEFLARGPDIHVGFCTGFNATFCTAHPNFHVVINAQYSYFDEPLSEPTTLVSRGHDQDAKKMTVMKSMKWFDHKVLPGELDTGGDFVHYRIEYEYHRDSAVLKVGHGEKSPDLLHKVLAVDIPDSPVAVFCVTFGAWMHAVEFRDARIV